MKIKCDREESALERVKAVDLFEIAFLKSYSTYSMHSVGLKIGFNIFISDLANKFMAESL